MNIKTSVKSVKTLDLQLEDQNRGGNLIGNQTTSLLGKNMNGIQTGSKKKDSNRYSDHHSRHRKKEQVMTKLQEEGSELGEISIDNSKYNAAIKSDTRISVQGSINAPNVKIIEVDRKNSSEQNSTYMVSVISPKLHKILENSQIPHNSTYQTAYDSNWNRLGSKKGSQSITTTQNQMKDTWQTPFQTYVQKLKDNKPQKQGTNMTTIRLNEQVSDFPYSSQYQTIGEDQRDQKKNTQSSYGLDNPKHILHPNQTTTNFHIRTSSLGASNEENFIKAVQNSQNAETYRTRKFLRQHMDTFYHKKNGKACSNPLINIVESKKSTIQNSQYSLYSEENMPTEHDKFSKRAAKPVNVGILQSININRKIRSQIKYHNKDEDSFDNAHRSSLPSLKTNSVMQEDSVRLLRQDSYPMQKKSFMQIGPYDIQQHSIDVRNVQVNHRLDKHSNNLERLRSICKNKINSTKSMTDMSKNLISFYDKDQQQDITILQDSLMESQYNPHSSMMSNNNQYTSVMNKHSTSQQNRSQMSGKRQFTDYQAENIRNQKELKNQMSLFDKQIEQDRIEREELKRLQRERELQIQQEQNLESASVLNDPRVRKLVNRTIKTVDKNIRDKANGLIEERIKVQRKMNRYVKRSQFHAENDQEDYVRNIVHARRSSKLNKEMERSNHYATKNDLNDRSTEIASQYLDHQQKLIKLFSLKQKYVKFEENDQTNVLKTLQKRSEAFGDTGFSQFLQEVIDKDHDFDFKQDKLEDDVYPRAIEKVINENLQLELKEEEIENLNLQSKRGATKSSDPSKSPNVSPMRKPESRGPTINLQEAEIQEQQPLVENPVYEGKYGSQFLNDIFKSIHSQNQVNIFKEKLLFEVNQRMEEMLLDERFVQKIESKSGQNAALKIEQLLNKQIQQQIFDRRTSVINFNLSYNIIQNQSIKQRFRMVVKQVNLVDRINLRDKTPRGRPNRKEDLEKENADLELSYIKFNHDLSFVDFKYMANMFSFKNALYKVFKLGNLGEKYMDLNKNVFAILPESSEDFEHLIIRQKNKIDNIRLLQESQITQENDKFNNVGIQELFDEQITKGAFYKEMKQKHIQMQDIGDLQNKMYNGKNNYLKDCQNELIVPSFVKIFHNQMVLLQQRIGEGQAKALQNFLEHQAPAVDDDTESPGPNQVRKLVLDDCTISDRSLAIILKGLREQNSLQELVISNNKFERESQEELAKMCEPKQISQQIEELYLTNLIGISKQTTLRLVESIRLNNKLFKLKLSKINLNDNKIVNTICSLICVSQEDEDNYCNNQLTQLFHLDLSWCQLAPKHLAKISEALKQATKKDQAVNTQNMNIRQLNLSYNSLQFDDSYAYMSEQQLKFLEKKNKAKFLQINTQFNETQKSDLQASHEFVLQFEEFLKKTQILNHLQISGMNLNNQSIVKLVSAMVNIKTFCSVHMNDLGINDNKDFAREILDLFGVHRHRYDVQINNRPILNQRVSGIDLIKKALTKENQALNASRMNKDDQELDLVDYKNYLIKAKQKKYINEQIMINQVQTESGVGRKSCSDFDNFVLTRKPHCPELIFNQNPYSDCYFNQAAQNTWLLSEKTECFIKDKHQYVAIVFNRDDPKENSMHMSQIKSKDFQQFLKNNINLNENDKLTKMPVILGTVTFGGWDRKLKMLSQPLYNILSVSNQSGVIDEMQAKMIQKGIVQLLKTTDTGEVYQIGPQFKGHQIVQNHKLMNNDYTDVMTIGQSERQKKDGDDYFVYAAYLPAGHHQFIIYNPLDDTFWTHDFVLELNKKELFTDFPKNRDSSANAKKSYVDTWRYWELDMKEDFDHMFLLDQSQKNFKPESLIKDEKDRDECLKLLKTQYPVIRSLYCHLQSQSDLYPGISLNAILKHIRDVHSDWGASKRINKAAILRNKSLVLDKPPNLKDSSPLPKYVPTPRDSDIDSTIIVELNHDIRTHFCQQDHLEEAFYKANRVDQDRGLKGSLTRGEFLDFIVRISIQSRQNYCLYYAKKVSETPVNQYLEKFINDYVLDTHLESEILHDRATIRNSRRLNVLLDDNILALTKVFDGYASKNPQKNALQQRLITQDQAYDIFMKGPQMAKDQKAKQKGKKKKEEDNKAVDLDDILNRQYLQKLFVYSKKTIVDETELDMQKQYKNMKFIEFLEMVCRVALKCHEKMVLKHVEQPENICVTVYKYIDQLFAAHEVFPLNKKKILLMNYQTGNASASTSEAIHFALKKYSKQMLELDKMVDEGQDPAEGDDIQEATYPVDKSILEEEEIIEDYVKKQIDIEEQIESEYN